MTPDPTSQRPRALLAVGLVLLAVVAVLGILVALDPANPLVQPLDDRWRRRIGSAGPEDGPVVLFFQLLGEPVGWVVLGVVVPVVLLACRRPWSALYWDVALLAGVATSQIGKYVVGRPRPSGDAGTDLYGPLFTATQEAYPSGHSTAAAVVAVAGAAVVPRAWRRWWGVLGALLCLGMAWQRTLVNAHWLTDTVGGIALGAACGLLTWWAMWPLLRRDDAPGRAPARGS